MVGASGVGSYILESFAKEKLDQASEASLVRGYNYPEVQDLAGWVVACGGRDTTSAYAVRSCTSLASQQIQAHAAARSIEIEP